MKIFSGTSNTALVKGICDHLSMPVGNIRLKSFPSGEHWCQYEENIRGEDVFLVQSTSQPANENLMQLLVMADAAKRASAGRLTAVIPYFGYARQDRKDKSRVPISAKLVMNLLAAAGFDRVLTMDLHAPQIGGFTDLPFDHLTFKPALIEALKKTGRVPNTIVAPDIGAVKKASEYADALGVDLVVLTKKRHSETKVELVHFVGEVHDRRVLIVDDLTESAGTLIEAAKACRAHGAALIDAAVTHLCFPPREVWAIGTGEDNLARAFKCGDLDHLFFSNTVRFDGVFQESGWLYGHGRGVPIPNYKHLTDTVDVAPIFGNAIRNISENKSVSELF